MSTKELGAEGEKLISEYIQKLGMRVLERNYHFGHEEIDIIARDGDTVAFIEVKTRTSDRFGRPEEAVTKAKQRAIVRTAMGYMKVKRLFESRVRFDVAAVMNGEIRYIKNAFDATGLLGR